jgi:hypothetical protein
MRYEMATATIVHLTGYPSEQNWNVWGYTGADVQEQRVGEPLFFLWQKRAARQPLDRWPAQRVHL